MTYILHIYHFMKIRSLSGFIKSKLDFIKQKQEEGFFLIAIHKFIEEEWGKEINYTTFLTFLHRARKNQTQNKNVSNINKDTKIKSISETEFHSPENGDDLI